MAGKAEIGCDAGKCTGCRLCMLACSWANSKTHRLQNSYIRVDVDEREFACRIFIDHDNCSGCLSCVQFCPGGALSAREKGLDLLDEGA